MTPTVSRLYASAYADTFPDVWETLPAEASRGYCWACGQHTVVYQAGTETTPSPSLTDALPMIPGGPVALCRPCWFVKKVGALLGTNKQGATLAPFSVGRSQPKRCRLPNPLLSPTMTGGLSYILTGSGFTSVPPDDVSRFLFAELVPPFQVTLRPPQRTVGTWARVLEAPLFLGGAALPVFLFDRRRTVIIPRAILERAEALCASDLAATQRRQVLMARWPVHDLVDALTSLLARRGLLPFAVEEDAS